MNNSSHSTANFLLLAHLDLENTENYSLPDCVLFLLRSSIFVFCQVEMLYLCTIVILLFVVVLLHFTKSGAYIHLQKCGNRGRPIQMHRWKRWQPSASVLCTSAFLHFGSFWPPRNQLCASKAETMHYHWFVCQMLLHPMNVCGFHLAAGEQLVKIHFTNRSSSVYGWTPPFAARPFLLF